MYCAKKIERKYIGLYYILVLTLYDEMDLTKMIWLILLDLTLSEHYEMDQNSANRIIFWLFKMSGHSSQKRLVNK